MIPKFDARSRALTASLRRVSLTPLTLTHPPSGSSRPVRQANNVDFPLPEGPTRAMVSPSSNEMLTPRKAAVSSSPT